MESQIFFNSGSSSEEGAALGEKSNSKSTEVSESGLGAMDGASEDDGGSEMENS